MSLSAIRCSCFVFVLCGLQSSAQPTYTKGDLQKLRWIEGDWSGIHQGKPFYEIYRFTNDSTLQITSYDWNGKDTTNTSVTYLQWNKEAYFLGDSLNWKVSAITSGQIEMTPHYRAANTIVWKRKEKGQWDAILTSKRGEAVYQMKRVYHFSK